MGKRRWKRGFDEAPPLPYEQTELERTWVSERYRGRLDVCFSRFCLFLISLNVQLNIIVADPHLANDYLTRFVQWTKDQAIKPRVAKHAILGFQHRYPHYRFRLARPWGALKAWRMELPLKSRVSCR